MEAAPRTRQMAQPPMRDRSETAVTGSCESAISDLTKRNVDAIAHLERAIDARRGHGDRVADAISRFVGSMPFIYLHVVWFGLWIFANTSSVFPKAWHLDPFPFTFLTFIV